MPQGRRRVWPGFLITAVCLLLAYGAWVTARPEKMAHAREQARLASQDRVWEAVPKSLTVTSTWKVLGDASWVPLGNPSTGAGRYYTTRLTKEAAVAVLEHSAVESGWGLVNEGCGAHGPVVTFSKTLGRWPATLAFSYGLTGVLGGAIHLPSSPGQAAANPDALAIGMTTGFPSCQPAVG
jgi:hypothetical protein